MLFHAHWLWDICCQDGYTRVVYGYYPTYKKQIFFRFAIIPLIKSKYSSISLASRVPWVWALFCIDGQRRFCWRNMGKCFTTWRDTSEQVYMCGYCNKFNRANTLLHNILLIHMNLEYKNVEYKLRLRTPWNIMQTYRIESPWKDSPPRMPVLKNREHVITNVYFSVLWQQYLHQTDINGAKYIITIHMVHITIHINWLIFCSQQKFIYRYTDKVTLHLSAL